MLVLDTLVFILALSPFILRDLPQQKIPRELWVGGDPAIFLCSHVPMKRFFWWDRSGKLKNTRRKGRDQENSNKQEGKNGRKKKKRFIFIYFLHSWRFPYSCVLHQSRTPLGYCPCATLPQENPLLQEPPLQLVILPSNPLSSLGGKKF